MARSPDVDVPRTVLVTGGDGLIGRALKAFLPADRWHVSALGRRELDVTRRFNVSGHFDHVVHAAGLSGAQESWSRVPDFLAVNVAGTVSALEYCRERGCSMTFLSTYVYGNAPTGPVSETLAPAPNTPYSLTKHLGEQCCEFYARSFGISVTVLRLFNVYGPGQSRSFLIPFVIGQALDARRDSIEVQDLSPRRDYVFISDVVSAVACTAGRPGFNVYNVGSGTSHSVSEVIDIVLRLVGVPKRIQCRGTPRTSEVADVRADISALQRDFGWHPAVSLDVGLAHTIDAMRKL